MPPSDPAWDAVKLWEDWRELHVLPFGGTDLMEHPACILEAITICEGARAKTEREHTREVNAKIEKIEKENAAKASRRP